MVKSDSENFSSNLIEVTLYSGQFVITFSEYFWNVFFSEHSQVDAFVKDIKVYGFLKHPSKIFSRKTYFLNLGKFPGKHPTTESSTEITLYKLKELFLRDWRWGRCRTAEICKMELFVRIVHGSWLLITVAIMSSI